MKELTLGDIERAATLGMDASDDEQSTGVRQRALTRGELWRAVMDDIPQSEYPADALSRLRDAYERGRSDFW